MDNSNSLYQIRNQSGSSHITLRLNGRDRFTVPRNRAAQSVCWKTFQPGRLELPLRAIASLPRLLGATGCVEGENLNIIRQTVGNEAGLSCCRYGSPGPWSKNTILFLHKEKVEPVYIVKAGAGSAVAHLLRNEANWLRTLSAMPSLAIHVPDLVAYQSGKELSFVAQRLFTGILDLKFGNPHAEFLNKLHSMSLQVMLYKDSQLYRNLNFRMENLRGLLSSAWLSRLTAAMEKIDQALSGKTLPFVAAHNDFIPWNIRVLHGTVKVFDWEYADYQQLPLFDLIHFALMPLVFKRTHPDLMAYHLKNAIQQAKQWLGEDYYRESQVQLLAYLVNLCTLYLFAEQGNAKPGPVLESYAKIIDLM